MHIVLVSIELSNYAAMKGAQHIDQLELKPEFSMLLLLDISELPAVNNAKSLLIQTKIK